MSAETSLHHTPGPWKVNVLDLTTVVYVVTENRCTIAVAHAPEHSLGSPEHKKQAEANARLIAAAPELLEVARLIAERIAECEPCGGSGLKPDSEDDACHSCGGVGKYVFFAGEIGDLETAIDKATGKVQP